MTQSVLVKRLTPTAIMPSLAHPSDVGFDLYLDSTVELLPHERLDLSTGIAVAMPDTLYGRITGRSSSIRRGLMVYEGIIDPGFRGELFAYALNQTDESIWLRAGERIAQLIFTPAVRPSLTATVDLPDSHRGEKGFGSSGR